MGWGSSKILHASILCPLPQSPGNVGWESRGQVNKTTEGRFHGLLFRKLISLSFSGSHLLFWHSSWPKRVRELSSCSGEPLTFCGFLTGFRGIPVLVFFSSRVWGIRHLPCNSKTVLGPFCKCGVTTCLSWTVLVYVYCSECLLIPPSFIPRSSPIWTINHCVSHLDSEDFRNLFFP